MASAIEKYEENVTSKRCGRATFTECVPLPPEARGLNASTAGSHKTYNSWRARSCFEHTKQAKVGGQSAGPKACLALLAERKQQRMLSRRRERLPFPLSRSPVRTFRVLLGRFIIKQRQHEEHSRSFCGECSALGSLFPPWRRRRTAVARAKYGPMRCLKACPMLHPHCGVPPGLCQPLLCLRPTTLLTT